MKTALLILLLLTGALIALFFLLGMLSKSGKAPGLIEGSLSKCPARPNCVCSEQMDDAGHYIDPISIPRNSPFDALPILKDAIQDMGGSIQAESDHYLAATFSSTIFGFVDDLEIRIDSNQRVIHIRSASRVGHGDLDVNRKRAETLKNIFRKKVSGTNGSLDTTSEDGAQ